MVRKIGVECVLGLWLLFGGCAVGQDIDSLDTSQSGKQKREKRVKKEKPKWDEGITETAYFGEAALDYTDRTYDKNIKTVLIHSSGSELEPPIINLNGTETIILRFDDMGENVRDMYYTFEHCTQDWQPSDLLQMDFQEGFKSDIINDYEFSFNTVKKFTHYRLEFPNDRIQLTRSGNYIIKVYTNSNPDDLILSARFMVVEPMARVDYVVRNSSVVTDRERRQEIDIEVNLGALESMNPYAEIELVVLQNFRWDNAKRGVKPSFIKDKVLTYNYQDEITFDGTNEFRFFDAKSLRYRSERIREVRLEDNGYHLYLSPDIPRAYQRYTFENDINGRFLIKNDDMEYSHLESDYVWVHFQVPVDAPLGNGNMHVFGQLSNWGFEKEYRMTYNPDDLQYEKTLLIKQGYYNYMYIWQYAKGNLADTYMTEGNHSQTENEYLILVYFKDPSNFSDRLIGFKKFSTADGQR